MVKVEWKSERVFRALTETGSSFLMNADAEPGAPDNGPTPAEAFLAASAACVGNEVLAILENMRQKVTAYRVEVETHRDEHGPQPRPYSSFTFHHFLQGEGLIDRTVEHAVELADQKYCSEIATLRSAIQVESAYEIEGEEGGYM
jgi:putative redox protein